MVTRTEFVKYPYRKYTYTVSGNTTTVTDDIRRQDAFSSGQETIVTNSNPLWRYQIAKRSNASTAYSRNWIEYNVPVATCESLVKSATPGVPHTFGFDRMRWDGGVPASFTTTDVGCDDRALAKLKRKISSHTKDFNALVPLGQVHELRQTISGAAALTTGLLEALISIRKTKGRSAFKYASEAWLTYGFGIAPLVQDTKDICEAIEAYLLRSDHSSVLIGTDSINWQTGGNVLSTAPGAVGTKFNSQSIIQHSLSYQYKGGFNFTLRSANDYGAMEHFHFELPALIPTAWELVPFSWVVDYFSTVGAFLEDCFTGSPVNSIYLNRTRKYKAVGRNYVRYVPVNGGFIIRQKPVIVDWSYTYFERTPLAAIPRRSLRFLTADEVGRYSLNKLLNLTSILGLGATNHLPRKPWR